MIFSLDVVREESLIYLIFGLGGDNLRFLESLSLEELGIRLEEPALGFEVVTLVVEVIFLVDLIFLVDVILSDMSLLMVISLWDVKLNGAAEL